jgi:YHS domain-containing protein
MDKKAQWSLVAAAWVLALGVIALGTYALRRFSAPSEAAVPQAPYLGTAMRPLCPVDHDEIALQQDTPRATYNGVTYYFCGHTDSQGKSHKTLFLMDPSLYLTGVSGHLLSAQAAAPAPAQARPVAAPSATLTVTPSLPPLPAPARPSPTPTRAAEAL